MDIIYPIILYTDSWNSTYYGDRLTKTKIPCSIKKLDAMAMTITTVISPQVNLSTFMIYVCYFKSLYLCSNLHHPELSILHNYWSAGPLIRYAKFDNLYQLLIKQ